MHSKTILYEKTAREALELGMNILSVTVSITLGPKGRNVVLGKKLGTPQIINDGVTIARELNLLGNIESTGILLIRQAASKTNDVAGDGTTTSTVLARSIIKEGMRNVAAGANAIILKHGIESASEFVLKRINYVARPVQNIWEVLKVASISSNDFFVGSLLGAAVSKVGREGIIFLEEGKVVENKLEVAGGVVFERGLLSGYFSKDQQRMETVLENAYILLTDKKITSVKKELLPTLELVSKRGKPLLIVCENLQQEALATLLLNKVKGILKVVAVRAPGFGSHRKEILSDLALLTGGQVISSDEGFSLHAMALESLGTASKIVAGRESTTIMSKENMCQVFSRCEQLRRKLEIVDCSYKKKKIRERLTRLSGGVAIIKVGGFTETEKKDRKLRLEDAVNATKAALEEGIVPGGGATFIHISEHLMDWATSNLMQEELIGALIVKQALLAPLQRIAENAGQNAIFVLERVQKASVEVGYDVVRNRLDNMFDYGIVDPVRVSRLSLKNAVSIAGMILTTECVICKSNLGT
jgi:chaperonin GroEL